MKKRFLIINGSESDKRVKTPNIGKKPTPGLLTSIVKNFDHNEVDHASSFTQAHKLLLEQNVYDFALIGTVTPELISTGGGVFDKFLQAVKEKGGTIIGLVENDHVMSQLASFSGIDYKFSKSDNSLDEKLMKLINDKFGLDSHRNVGWVGIGNIARVGLDDVMSESGLVRKTFLYNKQEVVSQKVKGLSLAKNRRPESDIIVLTDLEDMVDVDTIFITLDSSGYRTRLGDPKDKFGRDEMFVQNSGSIAKVARKLATTSANIVIVTNPVSPMCRLFYDEAVLHAKKIGVEPLSPNQIVGFTLLDTNEARRQVYLELQKYQFWTSFRELALEQGRALDLNAVHTWALGDHSNPFIAFSNTLVDGVPSSVLEDYLSTKFGSFGKKGKKKRELFKLMSDMRDHFTYLSRLPLGYLPIVDFNKSVDGGKKFKDRVNEEFARSNHERIKAGSTDIGCDFREYLRARFSEGISIGACYWVPSGDLGVRMNRNLYERALKLGGQWVSYPLRFRGSEALPRSDIKLDHEEKSKLIDVVHRIGTFYEEKKDFALRYNHLTYDD